MVKLKIEGKNLQIIVKDTGIGIEKKDLETMVFRNIFARSETAKSLNVTGRGINLYFCREIIEAHNGRIWVESEGKNKGSTFYIELPIEKL